MTEQNRIPLKEGLRFHWRYLVPLAVFPTVLIVAIAIFEGREETVFMVMVPFFFACGFYAGIPYRRKNVSYAFWAFACVMWMLAFVPAVVVGALIGVLRR